MWASGFGRGPSCSASTRSSPTSSNRCLRSRSRSRARPSRRWSPSPSRGPTWNRAPDSLMGRPILRTPLCELLGIEYPIILAGMGAGNNGGAAGPELVAAVSEAGGLGVLGGTGRDLDEFHAACAEIRRLTKKPFGVDLLLPATAPPAASQPGATGRGAGVDQRYWDWVAATMRELDLREGPPRENG